MTTAATLTAAWQRERSRLEGAVGFLTPFGRKQPRPSPESMAYFPLVGVAVGTALGTFWGSARRRYPPLAAAALVVTADAALTGALHLDGLADAADGLLAHVPAKDRLDIMAAPDIGAFGSVTLNLNLLLRTTALCALRPSVSLLAGTYCSSRALMVIASRSLPYARSQGLASTFLPDGPAHRVDAATVVALGALAMGPLLANAGGARHGALAVGAGLAAGTAVLALGQRRLGGFTGDVLGAAGVTCETAALLVAAGAAGPRGAHHQ